ncbi:MAG: hypothetical protein IID44_18515 [Planctomycetes bacterium]|nr:hypothetical protein [Planctomycetota bacterium]
MEYPLPADLSEQIKLHLATGNYETENDVIRQALDALKLRDELVRFRESIAQSRQQAARGEAKPLDVDAVMGRLRGRLSDAL